LSTDCRKPKLTRIPAHLQLRHHHHELYNLQQSLPNHTFVSKHPDYWISTSLSALHNISSSVFSVIIHSAFRSIASQAQLTPTRAPHSTTDTSLPTQHFAFLGHRRSGSTKKDLGTSVATPRVLGIEQRHRQSNLPYRNKTFSIIIINLYNYLWA
jgi:hypothetical protein